MRLIAAAALALALGAPGAGSAATRGFTVTDFDRIRLTAPYEVTVTVGRAVSARAEGPADALDAARLDVEGGTLTIGRDRAPGASGVSPGKVRLTLTVPGLRGLSVLGSGVLAVDRARAAAVTLMVAGAGTLKVGEVATDRLVLTLAGPGGAAVGGKAAIARIVVQGEGKVDAASLVATDAEVALTGAGAVTLGAKRTAKVTATGGGDVTVLGSPACTVRNEGTGEVRCGKAAAGD